MNEENPQNVESKEVEWQAPPIPEQISVEDTTPQMSEAATLGSIFFEPGRTFEDLRRKPRFLLAMLIMIVLTTAYFFVLANKVGDEGLRRFTEEQVEKSPRGAAATPEQKQQGIEMSMTIQKVVKYVMPLFLIIGFALGGLFYWLAIKAMGGAANYWHALSAFVYSSLPPTVVAMLANILILFLKSADDLDLAESQRGVVHANPGFFMDGKSMPVLATFLGTFDLFLIWGWILAAIGLQKLGKLSAGSAWTIVLIIALIGVTYRVLIALFTGNPT